MADAVTTDDNTSSRRDDNTNVFAGVVVTRLCRGGKLPPLARCNVGLNFDRLQKFERTDGLIDRRGTSAVRYCCNWQLRQREGAG